MTEWHEDAPGFVRFLLADPDWDDDVEFPGTRTSHERWTSADRWRGGQANFDFGRSWRTPSTYTSTFSS